MSLQASYSICAIYIENLANINFITVQAELAALMCKRSTLVRVRGPDGRNTFGGFGGSGEIEVVSARG